jgi:CRISPR/Cas system CSM-associated protein Csm3 (group 7 of RAMP superfamily)
MSFANPYNFVCIDDTKVNSGRQKSWLSHDTRGKNTGEIVCHMRFLSDFITVDTSSTKDNVNDNNDKKQLIINGNLGIQASSLKGLIRSTAEAISNSCISMISNKYKYRFMRGMPEITSTSGVTYKKESIRGRDYLVFNQKKLVADETHIDFCNDKNGLCICCTLFGTTVDEEESFTFKGKLRFSDAIYLGSCNKDNEIVKESENTKQIYLIDHSLSNPKNHHESFYLNGNKIKGRKFYYHHQSDKLNQNDERVSVELVKKDSSFKFTISFENLTEEEYGLLLKTIELEPGLGHKIGMGKPLGLGSCIIEVTEIKEFTKNRYHSIDSSCEIYNKTKNNIIERKNTIKGYCKTVIPPDLQCILTLDNGFNVEYPARFSNEFKGNLHGTCEDFSKNPIKSYK